MKNKPSAAIAILLAGLLAPRLALAEGPEAAGSEAHAVSPPAPPSTVDTPDRPVTTSIWYGWQTLAVDGAVLGTTLAIRSPLLLSGYAIGAPIVHLAHGNVVRAFGSLGVRVALPVIAGLAYAAGNSNGPTDGYESSEAAGFGVVLGGLTAIAIDAVFLARSERTVTPAPSVAAFQIEPCLSASQRGGVAGVGGSF